MRGNLAGHMLDCLVQFLQNSCRIKSRTTQAQIALLAISSILNELRIRRCRLQYTWQPLYDAMIFALKTQQPMPEILELVIQIFDIIITHGDSFLYDTGAYDACYYEIIRNAEVFTKMNEAVNQADGYKNILAILESVIPKIPANANITIEDVMKAVRDTYESLELHVVPKSPLPLLGSDQIAKMEHQFCRNLSRFLCFKLRNAWLLHHYQKA
jgi:hypothetical protein